MRGKRVLRFVQKLPDEPCQPMTLIGRQIRWNPKCPQITDRPGNIAEPLFQLAKPRGECRRGLRRQHAHGRSQKSSAVGGISDPIPLQDHELIPTPNPMKRKALEKLVLIFRRQARQVMSESRPDLTAGHLLLGNHREALGNALTLHYPLLLVSQQFGCRSQRQAILLEKRVDDQGFIKRSQSSTRGVGKEKQSFVIR